MVTNGEKLFVTLLSIRYATSTDQVRQIEDLLKNMASKKKKKIVMYHMSADVTLKYNVKLTKVKAILTLSLRLGYRILL